MTQTRPELAPAISDHDDVAWWQRRYAAPAADTESLSEESDSEHDDGEAEVIPTAARGHEEVASPQKKAAVSPASARTGKSPERRLASYVTGRDATDNE